MQMKRLMITAVVAVIGLVATVDAVVHEVTYKGTVVTAEAARVAVSVVDAKTKKPSTMTFRFDKQTKILRGDKVVAAAEARIQKDESIAVTINSDVSDDLAIVVRLPERK
jgi:maltose-binding protein MalE